MGRILIIVGVVFILAGVVVIYHDKIPFLGKLPGDISIKREKFSFYFPITTSILLSVIISIVLYFINRARH